MRVEVGRIIITAEALEERVAGLAREIAASYAQDSGGLTIISVLAGAIIFVSDLIRRLPLQMRIGLVAVSSYPGDATVSMGPTLGSKILPDLRNRNVLIVDDILETGRTLRLVQGLVRRGGPREVRTAVLLRKASKAPPDLPVEFVGFDIGDRFVIGYGLDYDGLFRNLPYVAELELTAGPTENQA